MALSYVLKAAASDLTGGDDFTQELSPDVETAGSLSVQLVKGATEDSLAFTGAGEPGSRAGTPGSASYTVEMNVTTGNTSINYQLAVARVNSAGTQQAISSFTTAATASAGAKSHTITADLGTFAAGDRLKVIFRFINTNSMSAQSCVIETGTVSTEVIAPWDAGTAPAAPTGLTATTPFADRISLSWASVPDAASYTIKRDGSVLASGLTTTSYDDDTAVPSTAYSYTVSATNAWGTSSDSAAEGVTAAAFTDPGSLSGLSLWVRADDLALADGAAVSSWTDRSPNARTVSQGTAGSQPTYAAASDVNSKPAVRFDGSSDHLVVAISSDTSSLSGLTIATVVSDATPAGTAQRKQIEYRHAAGNAMATVMHGNSGAVYAAGGRRLNGDAFTAVQSSTSPTTGKKTEVARFDFANGNLELWNEGTSIDSGSLSSGTTVAADLLKATIGSGAQTSPAEHWNGDIAEVVVYTKALTAASRVLVQDYLDARWAAGPAGTTVSPTGLASAGAVGAPVLSAPTGDQTVSPTGVPAPSSTYGGGAYGDGPYGGGEPIGSPTVTIQAAVAPSGVASLLSIGSPSLSTTVTVSPTGLSDDLIVGSPVVGEASLPQTVQPTGLAGSGSLGAVTVSTGVTVSPVGVPAPTGGYGEGNYGDGAYGAGAPIGVPVVTVNAVQTVSPAGVASQAEVGAPALSTAVTVQPEGVQPDGSVGTPLLLGVTTVQPEGVSGDESVGSPSLSSVIAVHPQGVADSFTAGSPLIMSDQVVTPTGVAAEGPVGSPTASTSIAVHPSGFAASSLVGSPSLTGHLTVQPAGIDPVQAIGAPAVANSNQVVTPLGVRDERIRALDLVLVKGRVRLHLAGGIYL